MMLELDNRNDEEKKKEPNKEFGYEQVNATKSIWTKNKSEVKEEEYNDFYKELSYDYQAPLANIHLNIE
jgi:molecular chaperone HtpG